MLVAVVATVIVSVAHPDIGNAGVVITLILVDGTLFLRTALLILPAWAVVGFVALLVKWNAEGKQGGNQLYKKYSYLTFQMLFMI